MREEESDEEHHDAGNAEIHLAITNAASQHTKGDEACARADIEHIVESGTGRAAALRTDHVHNPGQKSWQQAASAEAIEEGGHKQCCQRRCAADDAEGNQIEHSARQDDVEWSLFVKQTAAERTGNEDENRRHDEEDAGAGDIRLIGEHGDIGVDTAVSCAEKNRQDGWQTRAALADAVAQGGLTAFGHDLGTALREFTKAAGKDGSDGESREQCGSREERARTVVTEQQQTDSRSQGHHNGAAQAKVTDAFAAAAGRDDIDSDGSSERRAEAEAKAVQDAGRDDGVDVVEEVISERGGNRAAQAQVKAGFLAKEFHPCIGEQADENGGITEDATDQTNLHAISAQRGSIQRDSWQQKMKS